MAYSKEKQAEYSKAWAKKYPERTREIKRRSQAKHQEKINAQKRAWRAANREKLKAAKIKWDAENPELLSMYRARRRIKEMNLALDRSFRFHYSVTLDNYNAILAHQNGLCAICLCPPQITKRSRRLFIDHDHKTGVLRALLCHSCNAALGYLRENPMLMLRAAEYVKAFLEPSNADWIARVRLATARMNGEAHSAITSRGSDQRSAIAAD